MKRHRQRLLKTNPIILDEACRTQIEVTMREVAAHRYWTIHALNVLLNHVHVVVETDEVREKAKPEKCLTDFKAYTTRRLREAGLWREAISIWKHHGSTRYLKSEEALQTPVTTCCIVRMNNATVSVELCV